MLRKTALGALLSFIAHAALATQIFITSGTTWTVPQDWNSQSNTIEVVGSGGVAGTVCGGSAISGAGGGAYSKISDFSAAPGASVSIHFGAGSGGGVSSLTWFGSISTAAAEDGWAASDCTNGPIGGRASAGVGSVKYSGGDGGALGMFATAGAGGGAAGPHGNGQNFVAPYNGGAGDAGFGGAGGVNSSGTTSSCGGGACNGGNGTEWSSSYGSGGGGGAHGNGGLYGGGAGSGASRAGGLIVITYTPRNRVSSGVF